MSVKTEALSSFLSDVEYPTTAEIEKDWHAHDKFFGVGNTQSVSACKTALERDAFVGWDWVLDMTRVVMVACSALGFVQIPLFLYNMSSRTRFITALVGLSVSAFFVMLSTLETVLNPELFIVGYALEAVFSAFFLHVVYIIMCSWFPDLVTVMTSVQCAVLFLSYLFHSNFLAYVQYLLGIPVATFLFHFIRACILYMAILDTTIAPRYLETFINAVIVATTAKASMEAQQGMPNFQSDGSDNNANAPGLYSSLKLTARLPQAVLTLKKWRQFIKKSKQRGYGELVDETNARGREMVEMHIAQAFDESDVETTLPYHNNGKRGGFGDLVDSDLEDEAEMQRKDVLLEASKASSKLPSQHRREGDSDEEVEQAHFSIAVPEEDNDVNIIEAAEKLKENEEEAVTDNHTTPLAAAPKPPRVMTKNAYEMGKALKNVVSTMDKYIPLTIPEIVVQYPIRYLILLTLLAPVFPLCLVFASPDLFRHLFNASASDANKLHYSIFIAMCVTMSLVGVFAQIFGHKALHKIAIAVQFVCAILWEYVVSSASNKSIVAIVIILAISVATNLTLVAPMAYKYMYAENATASTGLVLTSISFTSCAAIAFLHFVRLSIVENINPPYTGPPLNTAAYTWCARCSIAMSIVAFYFVTKLKHLSLADRTHA